MLDRADSFLQMTVSNPVYKYIAVFYLCAFGEYYNSWTLQYEEILS
jgi:hypothetical protein